MDRKRQYAFQSVESLQQLAHEHGGQFLSTEYLGMRVKHQWQCGNGHRWWARPNGIQQGLWCPHCGGTAKKDIGWCRELAVAKGGQFLSKNYKNSKTKYQWKCAKGHRWTATPNDISQGRWCPKCAGKAPHDLKWLDKLASSKDGKCLTREYRGVGLGYLWQCSEGHQWTANAHDVSEGSWCPRCAKKTSKPEIQLLEFVKQFYPDARKARGVLPNKRYELDIYASSFNKAIEYDGYFWHHSEWATKNGAKARDARKNQQCQEVGVQLLRIRERDYLESPEKAQQQILEFLNPEYVNEVVSNF